MSTTPERFAGYETEDAFLAALDSAFHNTKAGYEADDGVANGWGGLDFRLDRVGAGQSTTRMLRITAVDGEWDAGCEIHLFDRHMCVLRSATLNGAPTVAMVVGIADALASGRADL